jgi:hypothetical protein
MLWAEENPALHWVLLERLRAADTPFSDKTLGDDQVALTADPLPIDWKPRFGFEVAVLSPDLLAAKEILEKLLDEDLEDVEIPAQDGAHAESLREEKGLLLRSLQSTAPLSGAGFRQRLL